MEQGPWDEALLNELSTAMRDASICGLGQAAPNPLQCVMKYFPEDLSKPLGSGDDDREAAQSWNLSSPGRGGLMSWVEAMDERQGVWDPDFAWATNEMQAMTDTKKPSARP